MWRQLSEASRQKMPVRGPASLMTCALTIWQHTEGRGAMSINDSIEDQLVLSRRSSTWIASRCKSCVKMYGKEELAVASIP